MHGLTNNNKKEQDLVNWASWPADELVRRWENGDFDYLVFGDRRNGNIEKLQAAYLKCKPQGAPSEGILFAISTEIIHYKDCDTPWKSRDWNPAYAAFPKPEEAAKEEVMNKENTNDIIGYEDSAGADATTSFTTAQTSMVRGTLIVAPSWAREPENPRPRALRLLHSLPSRKARIILPKESSVMRLTSSPSLRRKSR